MATLRGPGAPKKRAGTPGENASKVRPLSLERETGFEPATLSLGS